MKVKEDLENRNALKPANGLASNGNRSILGTIKDNIRDEKSLGGVKKRTHTNQNKTLSTTMIAECIANDFYNISNRNIVRILIL
jgi:hypothetical protein